MVVNKEDYNSLIKITLPGELFTGNPNTLKKEYLTLMKYWHTDNIYNAVQISDHQRIDLVAKINDLYEKAKEMIGKGMWVELNKIRVSTTEGRIFEIKFKAFHEFELGRMYIADSHVTYIIHREHKEMYDNAIRRIQSLRYVDEGMKKEITKSMPIIKERFETTEGNYGMILEKSKDLLLLKDVLHYFRGKIPERHVAWILTSLYNITCYIDISGLAHNGIQLDTYFISPGQHIGALLGGWWYCRPQGDKMIGVSKDIYSLMPPHIKVSKRSQIQTDLESIRYIGRQLLGDSVGTRLIKSGIPKPMVDWVRGVSSNSAIEEYKNWERSLIDSFGQKKYIPLELCSDDIYYK